MTYDPEKDGNGRRQLYLNSLFAAPACLHISRRRRRRRRIRRNNWLIKQGRIYRYVRSSRVAEDLTDWQTTKEAVSFSLSFFNLLPFFHPSYQLSAQASEQADERSTPCLSVLVFLPDRQTIWTASAAGGGGFTVVR
jgi:hypothetical protein